MLTYISGQNLCALGALRLPGYTHAILFSKYIDPGSEFTLRTLDTRVGGPPVGGIPCAIKSDFIRCNALVLQSSPRLYLPLLQGLCDRGGFSVEISHNRSHAAACHALVPEWAQIIGKHQISVAAILIDGHHPNHTAGRSIAGHCQRHRLAH